MRPFKHKSLQSFIWGAVSVCKVHTSKVRVISPNIVKREGKSVGIWLRPPHNGAICSLCPAPLPWAQWLSGTPDWHSEGLGFKSQLLPEFFLWINFCHKPSLLALSVTNSQPSFTSKVHTKYCITITYWFMGMVLVGVVMMSVEWTLNQCALPVHVKKYSVSNLCEKCVRVEDSALIWLVGLGGWKETILCASNIPFVLSKQYL